MPNPFFADLVRETTHATGTGPLTLAGAVPGHRRFADAVSPGASFHYAITSIGAPDQWETGVGSLANDGRVQRDNVRASSAGGARVDFAAGLKTVALTVGSDWFADQQTAVDDLALAVADKQPIATGHAETGHGEVTDRVTVRRAGTWFNMALGALAHRNAAGRFVVDAPVDAVAGSAAAVGIALGGEAGSGLFRPAANMVAIATGGTERVRIDSNGRVGIGTISPTAPLAVAQNGGIIAQFSRPAQGNDAIVEWMTNGVSSAWIGQVGWENGGNSFGVFNNVTPGWAWVTNLSNNSTRFGGSVGIGGGADSTLAVFGASAGMRIGFNGGSENYYQADIHYFRRGNNSSFALMAGNAFYPGSDNTNSLGLGSDRWTTVYAATGTINTSDAREKTWRGELNQAELRAAKRIAREIGVYQWNDAVEQKGPDKARLHVGVRAQTVWAVMADEGLVDAIGKNGKPGKTPYAFLCWDKWAAADDRAAGERFGVRVDQLALFIAAAQEQRLAALETRP